MNGLLTRRWLAPEPRLFLRDLGGLHRDIEGLFESVLGNRAVEAVADWAPRVETFLKDDTLHVRADLPGVDPKAVDISVEGDVLTVRGERKAEHTEAAYREVSYGSFERRIRVPDGVDPAKIAAKYTNGVLEIAVPIAKPVAKKVTVEIADAPRA
ncbi:MAG: Hsp20/alpha crystallin family protein [Candidatus Binatia bacterium]